MFWASILIRFLIRAGYMVNKILLGPANRPMLQKAERKLFFTTRSFLLMFV